MKSHKTLDQEASRYLSDNSAGMKGEIQQHLEKLTERIYASKGSETDKQHLIEELFKWKDNLTNHYTQIDSVLKSKSADDYKRVRANIMNLHGLKEDQPGSPNQQPHQKETLESLNALVNTRVDKMQETLTNLSHFLLNSSKLNPDVLKELANYSATFKDPYEKDLQNFTNRVLSIENNDRGREGLFQSINNNIEMLALHYTELDGVLASKSQVDYDRVRKLIMDLNGIHDPATQAPLPKEDPEEHKLADEVYSKINLMNEGIGRILEFYKSSNQANDAGVKGTEKLCDDMKNFDATVLKSKETLDKLQASKINKATKDDLLRQYNENKDIFVDHLNALNKIKPNKNPTGYTQVKTEILALNGYTLEDWNLIIAQEGGAPAGQTPTPQPQQLTSLEAIARDLDSKYAAIDQLMQNDVKYLRDNQTLTPAVSTKVKEMADEFKRTTDRSLNFEEVANKIYTSGGTEMQQNDVVEKLFKKKEEVFEHEKLLEKILANKTNQKVFEETRVALMTRHGIKDAPAPPPAHPIAQEESISQAPKKIAQQPAGEDIDKIFKEADASLKLSDEATKMIAGYFRDNPIADEDVWDQISNLKDEMEVASRDELKFGQIEESLRRSSASPDKKNSYLDKIKKSRDFFVQHQQEINKLLANKTPKGYEAARTAIMTMHGMKVDKVNTPPAKPAQAEIPHSTVPKKIAQQPAGEDIAKIEDQVGVRLQMSDTVLRMVAEYFRDNRSPSFSSWDEIAKMQQNLANSASKEIDYAGIEAKVANATGNGDKIDLYLDKIQASKEFFQQHKDEIDKLLKSQSETNYQHARTVIMNLHGMKDHLVPSQSLPKDLHHHLEDTKIVAKDYETKIAKMEMAANQIADYIKENKGPNPVCISELSKFSNQLNNMVVNDIKPDELIERIKKTDQNADAKNYMIETVNKKKAILARQADELHRLGNNPSQELFTSVRTSILSAAGRSDFGSQPSLVGGNPDEFIHEVNSRLDTMDQSISKIAEYLKIHKTFSPHVLQEVTALRDSAKAIFFKIDYDGVLKKIDTSSLPESNKHALKDKTIASRRFCLKHDTELEKIVSANNQKVYNDVRTLILELHGMPDSSPNTPSQGHQDIRSTAESKIAFVNSSMNQIATYFKEHKTLNAGLLNDVKGFKEGIQKGYSSGLNMNELIGQVNNSTTSVEEKTQLIKSITASRDKMVSHENELSKLINKPTQGVLDEVRTKILTMHGIVQGQPQRNQGFLDDEDIDMNEISPVARTPNNLDAALNQEFAKDREMLEKPFSYGPKAIVGGGIGSPDPADKADLKRLEKQLDPKHSHKHNPKLDDSFIKGKFSFM
jgi:hypothetical protein